MTLIQLAGALVAGVLIGLLIGFWARKKVVESHYDSIRNYSRKIIDEAHKKAKSIKKEATLRAKDAFYQMKLDFEKEAKEKKEQLQVQEKRLFHKEESLDKKIEHCEQKERKIVKREKDLEASEESLRQKQVQAEELVSRQQEELQKLAGILRWTGSESI